MQSDLVVWHRLIGDTVSVVRVVRMESSDEPREKGQVDKLWFNVSHVARRVGVHPTTVRRWEKEGFIPPAKRRCGIRVYSAQDLEIIEQMVFGTNPKIDTEQNLTGGET